MTSTPRTPETPMLAFENVRHPTVLIVEDEATQRIVLERVIHELDRESEILGVRTGEIALKILENNPVDLVISDLFLDGRLTGLNVWNYCKLKYPKVPMFMTSSLPVPAFLQLTRDVAEQPPYLPKPFTIDDCRRFVAAYLMGDLCLH